MSEEKRSVKVICPRCDHHVVTVSEEYHFEDDLICPGCGALIERPSLTEDLAHNSDEVEKTPFDGGDQATD